MNLDDLLQALLDHSGSDLHLQVGVPPKGRIRGDLEDLDATPLTDEAVKACIKRALTEDQVRTLVKAFDVDAMYHNPSIGRPAIRFQSPIGSTCSKPRIDPSREGSHTTRSAG